MNMKPLSFSFWVVFFPTCLCSVELSVTVSPKADTIKAGDSLVLEGMVKHETGTEYPEYASSLHWVLYDTTSDARVYPFRGSQVTFTSTGAHRTFVVEAVYPTEAFAVFAESEITVLPSAPYQVHIECDSIPHNLTAAQSPDTLCIPDLDSSEFVYAIVRDEYENYIQRNSPEVAWGSLCSGIAGVSSLPTRQWEAQVKGMGLGSCELWAGGEGLVGDTVTVVVDCEQSAQMRGSMIPQSAPVRQPTSSFDILGRKIQGTGPLPPGIRIANGESGSMPRVRIFQP